MMPDWIHQLNIPWQLLIALSVVVLATATSIHAVLNKRDHRAALLWVAFVWLSPVIGAVCYLLLGINRIRRRAAILRSSHEKVELIECLGPECHEPPAAARINERFADLDKLVSQVVGYPLTENNSVELLVNGDEAFPAMLQAIREARSSITLSTYIFDYDPAGSQFIEALAEAAKRKVEVRILIDDVGSRYSPRSVTRILKRKGICVAHFLPRFVLWRFMAMNLRSHRKIMVVDGTVAFTGGMNIRHGNCLKEDPSHPIQDLHFRLTGPVVAQLQHVFADDWKFCTQKTLDGEIWFPTLEPAGDLSARVIPDGPDEDFEKLPWTIHGGLNAARESILIATPYFLPDRSLVTSLNVAAMRGVDVDIVLPAKNNLPFVHWASMAVWWQMLHHGCRIWLAPAPFDHSKVLVVDREWSLIGSANLDPRSLRLNFEMNVEVYGRELASQLHEVTHAKMQAGRRITREEIDNLTMPVRLRNGICRLLTPLL